MTTQPLYSRIIVGVDGSEQSIAALREAAAIADAFGAPLEAVVVWEPILVLDGYFPPDYPTPEDDARALVADAVAAAFPGGAPPRLSVTTREGTPARVLIRESENADLLVLGSRGHGGFAGLLLGSVSNACAVHAKCPVLIVHPSARRSESTHDATGR